MSSLAQVSFDASGFILAQLQEHAHLVVEATLALFILYLLFHKSYKLKENKDALTHEEVEQLIQEFQPKPLIEPDHIKEMDESLINISSKESEMLCFSSAIGSHVTLAGDDAESASTRYVNFASLGVLNYQTDEKVIDSAIKTLRTNGVGSCGPRGFYGTVDVHMQLEERIAKFMGSEEAVLYSSGFATIASVLPAFSKPGDYLICDKGVSLSVQTGVQLSRSKVQFFNHNDLKDLRRILHAMRDVFDGTHRIFLVIEGLYLNYGDIAPLPEIMKLKEEYPFRLIIEESCSIGVLGKHGRGITEHFNIPIKDVEIIAASIGNAIGAIGGFSCGSAQVCSHQRLNSSGYVFSCSLPPFVSSAAIEAIDLVEAGAEVEMLANNAKHLHQAVRNIKALDVVGVSPSPIVHLKFKRSTGDRRKDEQMLQEIVDQVRIKDKAILTRSKYVKQERFMPDPSIRFVVSAHHSKDEIDQTISSIESVAMSVLNNVKY